MAADLLKYADMDSRGNDNKNNPCIVKILLATNTPLEVASTEGNTPLLRAVKNTEIVQMLLEKKVKVTALAIVKLLLRNPETQEVEIFGDIHSHDGSCLDVETLRTTSTSPTRRQSSARSSGPGN